MAHILKGINATSKQKIFTISYCLHFIHYRSDSFISLFEEDHVNIQYRKSIINVSYCMDNNCIYPIHVCNIIIYRLFVSV